MVDVRLSPKEITECERAAQLRSMLSRASGIVNQRKDSSRSDYDIDLTGIKGELAVAKVYQAEFNVFNFGVDSGVDMFIEGIAIDVKSTTHLNGKLLFKSKESFKSPYAILAIVIDPDIVRIAGWISRVSFAEEAKVFNANKTSLAMTQEELKSPESFWLNITKLRVQ
jgi:hypothetical protein|tara:strand:- start:1084 stop:1587 length:504 start_codon:yes stop_codon:yes gene_type:complete